MKILSVTIFAALLIGCGTAPKQPDTVTADTLPVAVSAPVFDTALVIQHIKEVYANIGSAE